MRNMACKAEDEEDAKSGVANRLIGGFFKTSSIPCLIKVYEYPSLLVKTIWALVLLAGTAACMWHCSLLIQLYQTGAAQTSVTIINQRIIEFPSVTICNMNSLKASKLKGTRLEKLVALDREMEKGTTKTSGNTKKPATKTATSTASTTSVTELTAVPSDDNSTETADNSDDDYGDYYSDDDSSDGDSNFLDVNIWDALGPADNPLASQLGQDAQDSTTANSTPPAVVATDDSVLIKANLSYLKSFARDENDVVGLMKGSKVDDFSDVLAIIRPTYKEIEDYGHRRNDLIQQCTFDAVDCSSWKWYSVPNQKYGQCYTFNHGVGDKLIKTNRFGSQNGLKLTLDPEVNEYVGLFSPTVGVRIVIHPSSIRPYPEQNGINAAAGFSTQIGIRKNVINRLESSSDCTTPDDPPDQNTTGTLKKTYAYSILTCLDDCVQSNMKKKCQCWDRLGDGSDNTSLCSPFNETQSHCRDGIYDNYDQGNLECDCKHSCKDEYFSTTISTGVWPSPRYNRILMKKLNASATNSTKQLAHVHIYFDELNYQSIDESLAYTLDKLFADLGGILGLYIGFSLCGMVEILEMAVIAIRLLYVAMTRPKIVPNTAGQ